jgi:chromosome segregation ATPase
VWSEELRRADERSSKFRAESASLQTENHSLAEQCRLLNERISARDAEITRLQVLTPTSGQLDQLRATHEQKRVEDRLSSLQSQNDILN